MLWVVDLPLPAKRLMLLIERFVFFAFDQNTAEPKPIHAITALGFRILVQISAAGIVDIKNVFLVVWDHPTIMRQ